MFGGYIKLGETIDLVVTVHRFSTGTEAAPTSGPVIIITKNGVDMVYAPTPTLMATGEYLFSLVLSSTNLFVTGARYTVRARATDADAVIGGAGITAWILSDNSPDDVAAMIEQIALLLDLEMAPRLADVEVYARSTASDVVDVKAKTDLLPDDPASERELEALIAGVSSLATALGISVAAIAAALTALGLRVPAALVGGRMDSSIGAIATDAISAAAVSAAAVTKIRDGLLSYSYASGRTVVGYIRRAGASLERAQGLKGTLVEFMTQAGVTIWSIAQNTISGTRGAIDLGSTEAAP